MSEMNLRKVVCLLCSIAVLSASAQTIIPLEKTGNLYRIACKINGHDMSLFFDTGASTVTLSLKEAKNLITTGELKETDIVGKTKMSVADGKVVDGTIVILREIKIQDIILRNVDAIVLASQDAPLLFGQSALEKLGSFTFDYSAKTVTVNSVNTSESLLTDNPLAERDRVTLPTEKFNEKKLLWQKFNATKNIFYRKVFFDNIKVTTKQEGEHIYIGLTFDIVNDSNVDFESLKQIWTYLHTEFTVFTEGERIFYNKTMVPSSIKSHAAMPWVNSVVVPIAINGKKTKIMGFKLGFTDTWYDGNIN